jgi:hypothetical protein
MAKTRLAFKTVELTPDGILIGSVEIIDMLSGESLRPAKLTKELAEMISCIEIDTDLYFDIQNLKAKNEIFQKLINTFNLVT